MRLLRLRRLGVTSPLLCSALFLASACVPAPVAAPPPPRTPPQRLSGQLPSFVLPEHAPVLPSEAHFHCTLTAEGTLKACYMIDGPAGHEETLAVALSTWRYSPPLVDGVPTQVEAVIEVPILWQRPPTPASPPEEHVITDSKPGEGMSRPVLVSGRQPGYAPGAAAMRAEGRIFVKCVITVRGNLERCKLLWSMPLQDQEVLDALATQVYRPILFKGQPVNVFYIQRFHFKMP